jgi:hypothetical protein
MVVDLVYSSVIQSGKMASRCLLIAQRKERKLVGQMDKTRAERKVVKMVVWKDWNSVEK